MTLDSMPLRQKVRITAIAWDMLPVAEAHRLRSLGLDVGMTVEPLHRGILFWKDPLAVRVGRMTIALRRHHARAMQCAPVAADTVGDTA